jgi:hypothetical protein
VKPNNPPARAGQPLDVEAAAPARKARVYEPPAICWEQPFVALAQTSTCQIPGESELCP